MISLQIEIDEESNLFLEGLAHAFGGDRGKAVMELIRAQQPSEEELDEAERIHHDSLVMQKERSERNFREGNWTTLDEVKRRYGL